MKSKIWLITGISSGLGKALTKSVIEKGDFVIGTFRKQSQVDEFNEKYSNRAFSILLDIIDEQSIERNVEKLISKFERIDVLVNNAGVGFVGAIEETSMEEARKVFEANFFGTLKLTQTILSHMRKEKNGHIVQISSHGWISRVN